MSRYTPGRYSTGYMFDRPSRTLVEEEPGLFLESSALRTIVDDTPIRRRDSPDRLLGRSSILSEKTNTLRSWDDPVGRYDNRSLREDILRDVHGKFGDSEYSSSSLPPLIGRRAASGRDSYSYLEKSASPLARVRATEPLPPRSSGSTSPLVGCSGRSSPSSSTGRISPLASTGRSSPSMSTGTHSPIMSEDWKSSVTGLGYNSPIPSYISSDTTPIASISPSVPLPSALAEEKVRTPFTPLLSTLKSDVSEEGYFTGKSDSDASYTKSRSGTSDDLQEDIMLGASYANVKDPYNRYGEGSQSIYSRPGQPPPSYDKYEEQSFPSATASETSYTPGTPKAYPMPDLSSDFSSPRAGSETGFNDAASDSSSERRYVVVNKDEPTGRETSYKYPGDIDRYGNDSDRNDQGEEVFRYKIKIDPGSVDDRYRQHSPDYSFTTGHGPDRIRIDIKHGDTPAERSHRRSRLRDLIGDFDFDIDEDWQSHASHIRDQFFGRKSGSLFDRDDDWDSFFGDRFSSRVRDSRDARDRVYGQESPRPREFRRSGSREAKEEKSTPKKGYSKKSVVRENEVEEIVGEDGKRRVIRKTKTEEEVEDDGVPAVDTKEEAKESITPTPRDAGDGSDNVFNKMDLHLGSIGRYDPLDCKERDGKNQEVDQNQERDALYFRDFDDLLDRLHYMRTQHPEEFDRRMRREGYEPKSEEDLTKAEKEDETGKMEKEDDLSKDCGRCT